MPPVLTLRRANLLIPIIALAVFAYIDYVACYIVAWKGIYHLHSKVAAIILWIFLALIQISEFTYWILILVHGPGSFPKFPLLDLYDTKNEDTQPVPKAFVSDEQGFPYWCTKCQNLKPGRAFHSSDLDRCIPKFDHYCLWIGTAIGRDNYLMFIRFISLLLLNSIFMLCFAAVFTRSNLHHHHSQLTHYILFFILDSFVLVFSLSLYGEVIRQLFTNTTTLDEITKRQARAYQRWEKRRQRTSSKYAWCAGKRPRVEQGLRYVNIAHADTRIVIHFGVNEHPYSCGFLRNMVNLTLNNNTSVYSDSKLSKKTLCLSLVVFFVPFSEYCYHGQFKNKAVNSYEGQSEEINPSFLKKLIKRTKENELQHASYIPGSNELSQS